MSVKIDKNTLTCAVLVIVAVLIGISFINPFFWIDDIIYYGAIALVLSLLCACGNKGGWNTGSGCKARGSLLSFLGARSTTTGKWCEGCGGRLPLNFQIGWRCPHCGAYIGGTRTVHRFFGVDVGESFTTPDDDEPINVSRPRHRDSSGWGSGWFGGKPAPRPTDREDKTRSRDKLPLPKDSDRNTEVSPFQPPFDDLFKDQEGIRPLFSHFINWVSVRKVLKKWVTEILTQDEFAPEGAKKDAWAKWEAWKTFEHEGFEHPTSLPGLYANELQNALKMEQLQVGEGNKALVCPECGATGFNIKKSTYNLVPGKKQEYMCTKCGMIFY